MGEASPRGLRWAFALSGAAGLLYEVTWTRVFALQLGGQIAALSALLAAYLGGLAAGGWMGSRWGSRSRRPLRAFAVLEVGTAILATLAVPILQALDPIVRRLYQSHLAEGTPFLPAASGLAASVVLPAAFLMGATLPLVVAAPGGPAGPRAGRLYAWNTGGAVLGTLSAGFLLLPELGNHGTLLVGAGGNLVAAGLALRLDGRGGRQPAAPPPARRATTGRGAPWLLAGLVVAGAASLGSQIVWTRSLTLLLGSSTYAFTLVLAVFLAGVALGAAAGSRLAGGLRSASGALVGAEAGAGAAALLAAAVLGALPIWIVPPLARAGAGFGTALVVQACAAALVVLPPTLFLGAAFPLAVRLRCEQDVPAPRGAGEVYAAGSVGMVAGAAATPFLLPHLGLRGTLLAAALALPGAALLLALGVPEPGRRGAVRTAGVAILLAVAVSSLLPRWDPALLTAGPFLYAPLYAGPDGGGIEGAIRRRGEILFHREGRDATVTVRQLPGGVRSLQINGKTDASTGGDMVTQLLAGHLPALLAPASGGSALVIGLASGVSLGAVERHPFQRIDCVELLPAVVEAAGWFDDASGGALADPRLRLIVADGRNHLRHAGVHYAVITSQPTNPWIAGTASLFTRETFAAARDRLDPGGVFSQWLQGYSLRVEDFRSVVASFVEVFPAATLWEESPGGGDYFLVGWNGATPELDLPLLRGRASAPPVAADLARAGVLQVGDLLAHFVAGPEQLAAFAAGASLQRDDRMSLEFTAARALTEDTLPEQVRRLRRHRESPVGLIRGLDPAADAGLLRDLRRARSAARAEERLVLSMAGTARAAPDPDLLLGAELLQAGLLGPAASHLERAAADHPAEAQPQILLGQLRWRQGETDAARRALRAGLALRGDDVAARALLARLEIEAGDLAAAADQLAAALRAQPDDAEVLGLAGAVALLRDLPAAALEPLERALELDPELPETWINLGVARRQVGDLPGALAAYRRAREVEPANLDARYNLGVALLVGGDPAAAREEFAAVLRADPSDEQARLRLAEAEAEAAGGAPPG